jgi:2-methylcitrate dehydratase PrpD
MTKSFHPCRAAQNGALAAFFAQAGFDSSERGIEAPRGFANVLSTKQDYDEIVGGLGDVWEAGLNSYKPYACGIVIHPTIDGCQQLRERLGNRVGKIRSVALVTHPLVLELTGKKTPRTGLEGKFSVYHAAATALLRGDGSPFAFTDDVVQDPAIVALRDRVSAEADPGVHEDAVRITVTLDDGSVETLDVEHALGSLERPLSNEALTDKFARQAAPVLGEAATAELIAAAWKLAELDDVGVVARAARRPERR